MAESGAFTPDHPGDPQVTGVWPKRHVVVHRSLQPAAGFNVFL